MIKNILKLIKFNRAIVTLFLLALAGCDSGTYKIPLRQGEIFTEETAIRVSREALKKNGLDITKIEPVTYKHNPIKGKENLLARNTLNSNNGYMLWHVIGAQTAFQYSVQMNKVDGFVICEVGPTK